MNKKTLIGLFLILLIIEVNQSVTSKEFSSSTIIRVPEDYPTIQQAIDASEPGGTILVAPGTYYERIIIDKPISLIGEDKKSTIIIGSGIGDVVYVSSDGVMISGFTIKALVQSILVRLMGVMQELNLTMWQTVRSLT